MANKRRDRGTAGVGRIRGRVFFDENRDGIRSPSEKPAAGVRILLDGRFHRITDSNGEYEFWPVHSGQHSLEIAEELLPLPWVVSETAPRAIQVRVRTTAVTDIPLVRIDE